MNVRHSKLPLAVGLALGLGMAAGQAQALGLGEIEVKSGLTQPLLAEIPILSASPEELEALDVHLASPEAFARVGLERPSGLSANLDMRVSRNARGQPVVLVTTRDKFNEPFLTFLLEASWGKGGVVREFSALVDPPYIAPAIIQPMEMPAVAAVAAPVSEPAPVAEAPVDAQTMGIEEPAPAPVTPAAEPEPAPTAFAPVAAPPAPVPAPPVAPAAPAPAPVATRPPPPAPRPVPPPRPVATPAPAPTPAAAPAAGPQQFGPVSSGQALWSIANQVRPDRSLSVNQMMLALQRANPDAFMGNNINRLKVGAVLRIPAADEIASVSAAEAAALVASQAASWQNRVAPAPQPAAARVAPATKPVDTAKPAVKPAAGGRLAIVPPAAESPAVKSSQSGASSVGGGSELRAELTQAKAQLGQTKEDLAARQAEVRELKSRVADLEAQQNDRQRLIDLQNSQLKAMQDRLAQLESERKTPAPVEANPPAPEVPAPVAEPADVASAEAPPAAAETAAPSLEAPATESPAPAPATDESPWYGNPLILGGIAGLGLLGLMLGRRGRQRAAPLPSRRISEDEAFAASVASRAAADDVAADEAVADTDTDTDIAPADVPEPALEVAAGLEADVPAQAVSHTDMPHDEDKEQATLLAAVLSRPDDLDAHLALLRLYHARNDAFSYETAAAKMHDKVGNLSDARWRQAVVMGVALAPRNPLFAEAGWNTPRFSSPPAATPAAAEDWRDAPTLKRPAVPAEEPALPVPVAAEPVDDLAAELAELAPAELTPVELAPDHSIDDAALDMALGLGGGHADIHRAEAEVLAEDEGSATKIELAKAYLEIGDADGAKAMLEEVAAEGGPAAKAEAERLLREIG